MTAKRGKFITLEGGEGAGKSTLLHGLAAAVTASGVEVITTREPGGTPLAEAIREIALHPPHGEVWSPMAEALLMNTARVDHIEKLIEPALARGAYVLSDRFADSTRAYQSANHGVSMPTLLKLEDTVLHGMKPDLTLILDAPPESLLARRTSRNGQSDTFEARDLTFHRTVRQAFRDIALAEPERCVMLDATQSAADLLSDAKRVVEARLDLHLSAAA